MLAVWIARRYLFIKKSVLSYVSRLALAGFILSISVLVLVVSVVNGFERELLTRILGVIPHLTVVSAPRMPEERIADLLTQTHHPDVVGIAPFLGDTVLLSANENIEGAYLSGVDPDLHREVSSAGDFTSAGGFSAFNQAKFGIVLGARLAESLQVAPGDKVLVLVPSGMFTPAGLTPRRKRFDVVDIVDSNSQLDTTSAYVDLAIAQRLFRAPGQVDGLHLKTRDLFNVQDASTWIRAEIQNLPGMTDHRFRVGSWMSTYGPLYRAIAVQKVTMFVLLSFLVGVAAFNLVSGLTMLVEQRQADIAVLRTLGAESRVILMLFMLLGLGLSIVGIVLGIAFGVLLANALPVVFGWIDGMTAGRLMDQYFIGYLPVELRFPDLALIAVSALMLAACATFYPAWRATRVVPHKVLAHE